MNYLVFVSHGELAPGMHTAVKMMCGEREDVLSTSLKDGMSTEEYRNNFTKIVEKFDVSNDNIVLLADIQGGSPFTIAAEVLGNMGFLDRTTLLCGMNLPMGVTACIMKDVLTGEELINTILSESRDAVTHFTVSANLEEEEI